MAPELVLASGSPRRREILDKLGVTFRVHPAEVEEAGRVTSSPEAMVLGNARLKCEAVASIFKGNPVLGADTSVFLEDRVLNKPENREEASFMLGQLSGRIHTVITGLCLIWREKDLTWSKAVCSSVTFRAFDWETARSYLARVNPLDKAGAYGIQEHGELLVASYSGSFSNIMGLPREETARALARFGIETAAGEES